MGRSNPQTTFFVVEESSDFVVNNTGRVLLIVTVGHEIVTVVAVHPIVGAQPNKAFFVLDNAVDLLIGISRTLKIRPSSAPSNNVNDSKQSKAKLRTT